MNAQLQKWLEDNNARALYELEMRDGKLERWLTCYALAGGRRILVEVWKAQSRMESWEVFAPVTESIEIDVTIAALDALIKRPSSEQFLKARAELADANRDLRDSINNWGTEDIKRAEKRVREAEAALEELGGGGDDD